MFIFQLFSRKLLTQLESFKSQPVSEKKSKPGSAPQAEESVKYELYVRPDQAKLEQASKVNLLT